MQQAFVTDIEANRLQQFFGPAGFIHVIEQDLHLGVAHALFRKQVVVDDLFPGLIKQAGDQGAGDARTIFPDMAMYDRITFCACDGLEGARERG